MDVRPHMIDSDFFLEPKLDPNASTRYFNNGGPYWSYLFLVLVPIWTIMGNIAFILAVRHRLCFPVHVSQYLVSLSVAQVLVALMNQVPTIVVYMQGALSQKSCLFLATLDIFALTVSPVHFIGIIWFRLLEISTFQFLNRFKLHLPAFVVPWLLTILVTMAAITDFNMVGRVISKNPQHICFSHAAECWIWVVPLVFDAIAGLFLIGLLVHEHYKNNAQITTETLVERCTNEDWTKGLALVFIDPSDPLLSDDIDTCSSITEILDTHQENMCARQKVAENSLGEAAASHGQMDSYSQPVPPSVSSAITMGYSDSATSDSDRQGNEVNHSTDIHTTSSLCQTLMDESVDERGQNSCTLLLRDQNTMDNATTVAQQRAKHRHHHHHQRRLTITSIQNMCLSEMGNIIMAIYLGFQVPYVIVNTIFCTAGFVSYEITLLTTFKWIALFPSAIVPIVHMAINHDIYTCLLRERLFPQRQLT